MWPIVSAILGGLFFATVIACVYLLTDRRRLMRDLQQREAAIEGYLDEIEQLRNDKAERDTKIAEQRVKLEGIDEKFKSLASDVLSDVLKRSDEQREQAVTALVNPIKNKLNDYNLMMAEIEKTRNKDYGALKQHLQSMITDQRSLRSETANLVKALRRPEVRGR